MPYGTVNADVIQTSTSGGILGAGNASIMKNRIINGAMAISQGANAGTITPAVTSAYGTNYPVDRWQVIVGAASKLTTAQSSTAATGFNFSTLITSSSAYTVGAGEVFSITQKIEGFNTADLAFGTANALSVNLSFWVRSSLTGTFGGSLQNSAANRSYPFSYTISSANTWEQKTITIAGDTTGTWIGATNGVGLTVNLGLGVGSTYSGTANTWAAADYRSATGATSVVGTSGATWYATGIQLEIGSSATGFEYRLYNQELSACQRYYQIIHNNNTSVLAGRAGSTSVVRFAAPLSVALRASPSVTDMGITTAYSSAAPVNSSGGSTSVYSYVQNATVILFSHNGFTVSDDRLYGIGNNTNSLIVSAEL